MLQRAEQRSEPKPLEIPEDYKWIPDIKYGDIMLSILLGVWVCFVRIVTVPWFLPLIVRKYLFIYLFLTLQKLTVERI